MEHERERERKEVTVSLEADRWKQCCACALGVLPLLLPFRLQQALRLVGTDADLIRDVDWLLGFVRVTGALVYLHVETNPAPKAALWQHAIHSLLDDSFRNAVLQLLEWLYRVRTWLSVHVPHVSFLIHLVPAHDDLLGVDDDEHCSHVHRWAVCGCMFTTDIRGCQCG